MEGNRYALGLSRCKNLASQGQELFQGPPPTPNQRVLTKGFQERELGPAKHLGAAAEKAEKIIRHDAKNEL